MDYQFTHASAVAFRLNGPLAGRFPAGVGLTLDGVSCMLWVR